MAFKNEHIFATNTQNPCLMDSDIPSLEDAPSENLEASWIPKEFTSATVEGTGFSNGVEARLQLDDAHKPAVVIDTWTPR